MAKTARAPSAIHPAGRTAKMLNAAGLFSRSQQAVAVMAALAILIGLAFLQKLGIPFGDEPVEFCLPAVYAAVAMIIVATGKIGIDVRRMIMYVAFAAIAVASNNLSGRAFSYTSLIYVLAIYFPFVFKYYISQETYSKFMNMYVNVAMILCVLVIIQHALQLTVGAAAWPNMDRIFPREWLVPGYVYVQPIKYGMAFMKPNAFFLLEASFVSQFAGLGLIVELMLFGRTTRLVLLTAGLLLSFAGTGILLVLVCIPFLLTKMPPRAIIAGIVALGLAALLAVETGWYEHVSHRLFEFQQTTSSANERFVRPGTAFLDFIQKPDAFFSGVGAGQIPITGAIWWPVTKVTIEYGVLTAVSFYIFFCYSLFSDGANKLLGLALFVFYNFLSGSFAVPLNALMCVFFCTLFRVATPPRTRSGRPSSSSSTTQTRARTTEGRAADVTDLTSEAGPTTRPSEAIIASPTGDSKV